MSEKCYNCGEYYQELYREELCKGCYEAEQAKIDADLQDQMDAIYGDY